MANSKFPDTQLVSNPSWSYGPDECMLISKAIGYTLKIIKSGVTLTKYRSEISAIRHGDYDQFFGRIKQPSPFMVQGTIRDNGLVIKTDNFSQSGGDCDMAMIIAIDPSLKRFYPDCWKEYGVVNDTDISDDIFNKCAAFEIALRVHNNNNRSAKNIAYNKQATFDLINVIDELCMHKNIPDNERLMLQDGRQFLNMIKHYKRQFTSWQDGIRAFNLAWDVCTKYNIRMV